MNPVVRHSTEGTSAVRRTFDVYQEREKNSGVCRSKLQTEKSKRKETQLIAQAAQGKVRAWTGPFERLPFHRDDSDREGLGALERDLRNHKPMLAPSTAQNESFHAKPLPSIR
jgi:hypothetical protein